MKIPTTTVNPKDPWKPLPERPFIQKANKRIWRYGNRYNVHTDKNGKTEIIDLKVNFRSYLAEGKPEPGLIREVEMVTRGRKKFVVIDGTKEIPLSDLLFKEEDI